MRDLSCLKFSPRPEGFGWSSGHQVLVSWGPPDGHICCWGGEFAYIGLEPGSRTGQQHTTTLEFCVWPYDIDFAIRPDPLNALFVSSRHSRVITQKLHPVNAAVSTLSRNGRKEQPLSSHASGGNGPDVRGNGKHTQRVRGIEHEWR
jgi:hypothetical protein